ncbi:MAG: PTS sugar transporter subunit IIA [Gammaproteobacteria bacterium]
MQISEIISPDKISCHVHASSKKGALEELSKLIASDTSSLVYTEIFDCFNARERLGSTGLGNGVAIPHGRLKEINQPVASPVCSVIQHWSKGCVKGTHLKNFMKH